jgi:hypothetical protein
VIRQPAFFLLALALSGPAPARALEPVYNTVITQDVVDGDQYARDLLARIHADSEGRRIKHVRMFWVSDDPHPNAQTEAAMRVIHLGLQTDSHHPRQVIDAVHVTRAELQTALEDSVRNEKVAFQDRMIFSKIMLEDGVEPVAINHRERGLLGTLFHRTKTKALHFFGVPNGIKTWEIYNRPMSRHKILINLVSATVQVAMYYVIGDHFLRPVLGDAGFMSSFLISAAWTYFFGVTTEQSLAWRTQGVQFQSGLGEGGKQGMMVPSKPGMIAGSMVHSLLSGQTSTAGGLWPNITWSGQLDSAVSSGNSTMTKSVWELAIRRLQIRETERRRRRILEGRPMKRPEWLELGYLLNTSFGIINSTARFLDQYHIIPGLRRGLMALGIGGFLVEMFGKERARTVTGFHEIVRHFNMVEPHMFCENLLQVEYEE